MRNLSEHRHCLALIAQQLQRIVAGAQHISSEFTQVDLVCAALLSATAVVTGGAHSCKAVVWPRSAL